ncbi:hypothetical protein GCM10007304_17720 [Rhodococcoides trifolii]|uniref:Uncharacterized protein n=1 Tax=Rhodococcoides trifolii TaxID=908250 RepID=A0A917CZU0_9NOCA|nr:hypothetical protein [Rhodococcus trifolii]GGG04034.1 hypothetical protein GCM10007304_17720 [Rhodococcus trifolii]
MVRIQPAPDKLQDMAQRLLDAADSPSEVATCTNGSGVGFEVSEELARKAGVLDEASDDEVEDYAGLDDVDVTADLEKAADEAPDAQTEEQTETGLEELVPETEQTNIVEEQADDTETEQEPPRTGRGSSEAAWREFLSKQDGFTVPDDADRGDLIAAWDAHRSTND